MLSKTSLWELRIEWRKKGGGSHEERQRINREKKAQLEGNIERDIPILLDLSQLHTLSRKYEQKTRAKKDQYLRPQLRDPNPPAHFRQPIPILPTRLPKLRTLHNDFAQRNSALSPDRLNAHMDARVEAKYQSRIRTIEH
jgi:hypothetical protein